jgi:hypothetical protein
MTLLHLRAIRMGLSTARTSLAAVRLSFASSHV